MSVAPSKGKKKKKKKKGGKQKVEFDYDPTDGLDKDELKLIEGDKEPKVKDVLKFLKARLKADVSKQAE